MNALKRCKNCDEYGKKNVRIAMNTVKLCRNCDEYGETR